MPGADALSRAYQTGASSHPTFTCEEGAFLAFLRERHLVESDLVEHAADLFLACACLSRDPQALAVLESQLVSAVPAFVAKVERDPTEVSEIQQSVREKLLVSGGAEAPRLARYSGRGSLGGFVRMMAVRVALDRKRRRPREAELSAGGELGGPPDPELDYLRDKYRVEFLEALEYALAALDGRGRAVLRMNMLDGLSIDRIASSYDVHRATVARWVADARAEILALTKRRLTERMQLRPDEVESIVRLVGMDLEVSVRRLLSG